MTKFNNLTAEQKNDFIISLQKKIGRKFRKHFQNNIISSKEAKMIMDDRIWNFRHLHLGELKKDVILATKLYITHKIHPEWDE